MAVSPDLVGFAESAGLAAVGYGLDTRQWLDTYRYFWASAFHNYWKLHDLLRMWRELRDCIIRSWTQMSATLTPLAGGADEARATQAARAAVERLKRRAALPR